MVGEPLSLSVSPKWRLFASQVLTVGEPLQLGKNLFPPDNAK